MKCISPLFYKGEIEVGGWGRNRTADTRIFSPSTLKHSFCWGKRTESPDHPCKHWLYTTDKFGHIRTCQDRKSKPKISHERFEEVPQNGRAVLAPQTFQTHHRGVAG